MSDIKETFDQLSLRDRIEIVLDVESMSDLDPEGMVAYVNTLITLLSETLEELPTYK